MHNIHSPVELGKGVEPIPGYVLQERIGAGGFGEVWRSLAPGGLVKAVKFVYGRFDEVRAARELKSLQRIKEVRHPFLLSLERIEVIDGHLVIVTELADSSLRDRFVQCRKLGLMGIPRKELLVYLRDTADALDFLCNSKAVQHLDVKPENLLLVGNRIKVADFGLLSDIRETSASLTSLTPTYSPPEVFDGRTNRQSDQYSLAIVFQEMLTGELPFDGRTPAQLAAQHIGCEPDLRSLSPADRFALARALSKDPEKRFGSCGEFANCLIDPTVNVTGLMPSPPSARELIAPGVDDGAASQSVVSSHDGRTIVVCSPEITKLPALELDSEPVSYRPTIFVGIGGTAGRVLRHLRKRFTYHFGSGHAAPALQMLFLDTHIDAIKDVTSGDDDSALQPEETLLLRLREPQAYRDSMGDLASISRRWIYNIPRSRRTEGLRSLGRIALLDHAQSVLERLNWAIATATDRESIIASSRNTRQHFRLDSPRVFVIASIAGGTGGGMVLELGYAVRQVLAELSLGDSQVCGILIHSTREMTKTRGLAASSAYACLTELRHYSQPGNDYPGEPTRGLGRFRESSGPFRSTYVVHFGEDLRDPEFDNAAERLAEYLFLNSASPACQFFDESRRLNGSGDNSATPEPNLRTIGLFQLSEINNEVTSGFAEALCKKLVCQWRGGIRLAVRKPAVKPSQWQEIVNSGDIGSSIDTNVNEDIEHRVSAFVSDRRLNVRHLSEHVRKAIECALEADPETYFRRVIAESLSRAHTRGELPVTTTCRTIDAIFGVHGDALGQEGAEIEPLRAAMDADLSALATTYGVAMDQWLYDLVNTSGIRVDGALCAMHRILRYLKSLSDRVTARILPVQQETLGMREDLLKMNSTDEPVATDSDSPPINVEGHLLAYAQSRLNEVVFSAVGRIVMYIESHFRTTGEKLSVLWTKLNQLTVMFDVPSAWEDDDPQGRDLSTSEGSTQRIDDLLLSHKAQLVDRLDQELEASLFQTAQNRRRGFSDSIGEPGALAAKLRAASRRITVEFLANASCGNLRHVLGDQGPQASVLLRSCLEAATPRLLKCGGASRLLLSVSRDLEPSRLVEEIRRTSDYDPTVVSLTHPDMVLCCEAEGLCLEIVAAELINSRPDYAELASRLHSRIDVHWS